MMSYRTEYIRFACIYKEFKGIPTQFMFVGMELYCSVAFGRAKEFQTFPKVRYVIGLP